MSRLIVILGMLVLGLAGLSSAQQKLEKDIIPTAKGDLEIVFLGHGSLMMAFAGKIIHVDPYGEVADYGALPKADLVLVTHEHFDHLDPRALAAILKPDTQAVGSESCAGQLAGAVLMANGDVRTVLGLPIEAVPAYNIARKRPDGNLFHPPGRGNGYVVTFGDKRVYIAGDTEATPQMKALKDIDVAFLPMNLPYTMSPEEVAEAARAFRPKVLYPYHFGDTDTSRLLELLQGEKDIEVRIRKMS
ncbi:MAG TPA: MBL fold metallo-hydrolase [Candidatus Aminicenantes bacterium]|nr:MBL fold metallo-hydrolase [Candidatus Aminicenantes bacterium]HDT14260.1 MBL fold metallo-hydrolase [Candidatus Aminicenantes bacterium]